MVDYNINLAKSMTSSPEERKRFYNRMLIYLVICAAAMVGVAFLSSGNLMEAVKANRARKLLVRTKSAVTQKGDEYFKNPEIAYRELEDHAADMEILRSALQQHSQFLPVLNHLFKDVSVDEMLQSLSASTTDNSIQFVLKTPTLDDQGKNILQGLQDKWQSNKDLQARVDSVTQLTSESEWRGDIIVERATYRCMLK